MGDRRLELLPTSPAEDVVRVARDRHTVGEVRGAELLNVQAGTTLARDTDRPVTDVSGKAELVAVSRVRVAPVERVPAVVPLPLADRVELDRVELVLREVLGARTGRSADESGHRQRSRPTQRRNLPELHVILL